MDNNYPESDWLIRAALEAVERLRALPDELKSPIIKKVIADWDARMDDELREILDGNLP